MDEQQSRIYHIYIWLKNRYTKEAGQEYISGGKQEPEKHVRISLDAKGRCDLWAWFHDEPRSIPAIMVPIAMARQRLREGEGQDEMSMINQIIVLIYSEE